MLTPRDPLVIEPGHARADAGLSITEFLTDGSVARLCEEMCRVTGAGIYLRDLGGSAIMPADEGPRPWRVTPERRAAEHAALVAGFREPLDQRPLVARLSTSAGVIGELVLHAPWAAEGSPQRAALGRTLGLLSKTVCEAVEGQLSLRERVHELDALFRLSSMLVRADEIDHVLRTALDLAIEVLKVDAGSIAVFEGETDAPVYKASRNLSPAWLAESRPLTGDGSLRKSALEGRVVFIADVRTDARIVEHARAESEGVRSLLIAGMLFQGRPLGIIRLYSRSPRLFSEAEGGLLRSIAEQAAAALAHARLRVLREEDKAIQRQVAVAAQVQRRMLPRTVPDVPPFDVAARYRPSFELGGDYYDFLELGSAEAGTRTLGAVVGDVVGKGVPAALLMSAIRAYLRAYALEGLSLDEVVSRVNRAVARDTQDHEFATLWMGAADPRTLRLTYCGAGHDPPLIVRVPEHRPPTAADVDELPAGGMALGIDPSQRYQVGGFDLRPGDVLVAYTDGLTDARSFEGRKFGKSNLIRILIELFERDSTCNAANVIEHIFWELRQFSGVNLKGDDVTVAVLKVNR
ncbi:MAG: SpoIIE family protein phosphatase [Phycisphaerae bacterium]|nr:SpoIIE family protein phosphatase [Phycisphaerae bacterium]